MKHEVISLRPDDAAVTLTTYLADERRTLRDALLVIPGGGYACVCSDREGEPIALAFLARGYNTFVLHYSVGEKARFPRPLEDASLAMQYIRKHAEEFGIDPRHVFAVGFSAGGHLCASLGSLWNLPELKAALPDLPEGINRPSGTILCYAVLSAMTPTHRGSFYNILGNTAPDEEELSRYSIDCHVGAHTSPAFFVHTADDPTVPVQNALVTMQAMADHRVSFDARIYPHGPHGIALADAQTALGNPDFIIPEAMRWVDDAAAWMADIAARQN